MGLRRVAEQPAAHPPAHEPALAQTIPVQILLAAKPTPREKTLSQEPDRFGIIHSPSTPVASSGNAPSTKAAAAAPLYSTVLSTPSRQRSLGPLNPRARPYLPVDTAWPALPSQSSRHTNPPLSPTSLAWNTVCASPPRKHMVTIGRVSPANAEISTAKRTPRSEALLRHVQSPQPQSSLPSGSEAMRIKTSAIAKVFAAQQLDAAPISPPTTPTKAPTKSFAVEFQIDHASPFSQSHISSALEALGSYVALEEAILMARMDKQDLKATIGRMLIRHFGGCAEAREAVRRFAVEQMVLDLAMKPASKQPYIGLHAHLYKPTCQTQCWAVQKAVFLYPTFTLPPSTISAFPSPQPISTAPARLSTKQTTCISLLPRKHQNDQRTKPWTHPHCNVSPSFLHSCTWPTHTAAYILAAQATKRACARTLEKAQTFGEWREEKCNDIRERKEKAVKAELVRFEAKKAVGRELAAAAEAAADLEVMKDKLRKLASEKAARMEGCDMAKVKNGPDKAKVDMGGKSKECTQKQEDIAIGGNWIHRTFGPQGALSPSHNRDYLTLGSLIFSAFNTILFTTLCLVTTVDIDTQLRVLDTLLKVLDLPIEFIVFWAIVRIVVPGFSRPLVETLTETVPESADERIIETCINQPPPPPSHTIFAAFTDSSSQGVLIRDWSIIWPPNEKEADGQRYYLVSASEHPPLTMFAAFTWSSSLGELVRDRSIVWPSNEEEMDGQRYYLVSGLEIPATVDTKTAAPTVAKDPIREVEVEKRDEEITPPPSRPNDSIESHPFCSYTTAQLKRTSEVCKYVAQNKLMGTPEARTMFDSIACIADDGARGSGGACEGAILNSYTYAQLMKASMACKFVVANDLVGTETARRMFEGIVGEPWKKATVKGEEEKKGEKRKEKGRRKEEKKKAEMARARERERDLTPTPQSATRTSPLPPSFINSESTPQHPHLQLLAPP